MGRVPYGVRWIDINEGDEQNPELRSRLVCKQITGTKSMDNFAATPPAESLRYVVSITMTAVRPGDLKSRRRLRFLDVRRAHFHSKCNEELYIELPDEDPDKRQGFCGRLLQYLYGTKRAEEAWESEYVDAMTLVCEFKFGMHSVCVFHHAGRTSLR